MAGKMYNLPYMSLDADEPKIMMHFRDSPAATLRYDVCETGAKELAAEMHRRGWATMQQSSACNHSEEYGIASCVMNRFEGWLGKELARLYNNEDPEYRRLERQARRAINAEEAR